MSIGPAIVSKILATTSVTTLIGTRFYPGYDKINDKVYPLAVYKIENVTPILANDGPTGLETADVVIACIGSTPADSDAVATVIQAAMDGARGTWAGITVQGMFLKDDGISEDVITEPQTEEIIYFIKELSFTVSYSR